MSLTQEEEKIRLKIVNASAGSGKTYRLVKEFITLLISDKHVKSFSSILAMTFTNKAALEMKERIIGGLDKISSPNHFENVEENLTKELAKDIGCTIEEVQKRCHYVLQNILHQYENFNVMTIDKFNLRLIRSFGRDLDLAHDFDVVMDQEEVIEKIVDDLINQIGQKESEELSNLLFKYAESNIEEDKGWDFRRNLIKFGNILTSERNRSKVELLLSMDLSVEKRNELYIGIKQMDSDFIAEANKIYQIYDSGTLDESKIPGQSNSKKRLDKVTADKKFFTAIKAGETVFTKTLNGNLEKETFPGDLKDAFLNLHNYWEENVQQYASTALFLNNFFNMAVLQFMAKSLVTIKKEEQLILISEFSKLISELIQGENTPFIYERLGTRYQHYLLDEFQDTSHMQWLNLVPLVEDSIANNNENLIVGDAKQSIYRFRNGVAEQFIALPEIYNPEGVGELAKKSKVFKDAGKVFELTSNYRSSATIVNFNNSFFETMKARMPESTASYYKSISQHPQSEKKGLVSIVSEELKTDDEQIINQLVNWIDACKKDGFNYGDICILGNKNKNCNAWAVGLTQRNYKVVSSDSLLIDSDTKVQLSIAYLKWRLKSGKSEKKRFAELFFRSQNASYKHYQRFISESTGKDDKVYRNFDDDAFLTENFESYERFFFKSESIYDLIQGFYRLMDYNELENSYLHHLADEIYEFELKKGPNLRKFLDHYQRNKSKIAVQIPESSDAIKIMTIHKAKGLEFPVVLMPTLNYKLDIKSSFLVQVEDFLVYKKPSKNDLIIPLLELYNEEMDQVTTDFINLCYVAMTRPIERLYIQNYYDKGTFGDLFHSVLKEQENVIPSENQLHLLLSDGKKEILVSTVEAALFEPKNIKDTLWFPDLSLQDNAELYTEEYLSKEMQFGLQFHLLASRIEAKSEIEQEISKGINAGEIEKSQQEKLRQKLDDLLSLKEYKDLFVGKIQVLNEQAFLVDSTTTLRPDKIILKEKETIVIDYKTGIPNAKDEKQVKGYCDLLKEMKYSNVKGYLFYSGLGELRRVG
ncbi:MAG: UvrD-helicase domain-containing protein [Fluviicola sp.]|nr:UvrD-helicase domain-containing protein [Fluviicola sp.]